MPVGSQLQAGNEGIGQIRYEFGGRESSYASTPGSCSIRGCTACTVFLRSSTDKCIFRMHRKPWTHCRWTSNCSAGNPAKRNGCRSQGSSWRRAVPCILLCTSIFQSLCRKCLERCRGGRSCNLKKRKIDVIVAFLRFEMKNQSYIGSSGIRRSHPCSGRTVCHRIGPSTSIARSGRRTRHSASLLRRNCMANTPARRSPRRTVHRNRQRSSACTDTFRRTVRSSSRQCRSGCTCMAGNRDSRNGRTSTSRTLAPGTPCGTGSGRSPRRSFQSSKSCRSRSLRKRKMNH